MAYYFVDGVLSDDMRREFEVKQVGLSANIYNFAKNDPLLYGIVCVLLAILAGWLSNRLKEFCEF